MINEETQRLLKTIYDDCEKEDTAVRQRQIREWRRLKLIWEGFTRIWYSEVAHDWRIWDQTADQESNQSYYDKPVNVFKAYLESIIAALSVTVPTIKCYPDDADNSLDLATAKAGDKISELIYRHNNVTLLWLHALFIFCTEGMTACYSYPKEDDAYGTYEEKEHDEIEEEHQITKCSNCGHVIDDQMVSPSNQSDSNQPDQQGQQSQPDNELINSLQQNNQTNQPTNIKTTGDIKNSEIDEFMPDDEDAKLHHALFEEKDLCPSCMTMMDPEISREKLIVTRLVGVTTQPKSRICMEVYGGLYVKIPNYAKKQKDIPYLIFSYEEDYSLSIEKYKDSDNKDLVSNIKGKSGHGSYDQYAQWGRLSPQYQTEFPTNVVTVNNCWLRPAKYNILKDQDDINKLRKQFPDGCKVIFINEQFVSAENEALDDCWTLTENPFSDFLHHNPAGHGLVSIQEITNDLISLILQTIEHGIGQTFADPAVLDFKGYAQTEVIPGGIYPAKPKSGKQLGEGFHELRTATLSGEILPFFQSIQSQGQLVSGATPSIFGGQLQGVGGETASGYSMSRAQAMQRLQNNWKIFTIWWKNIAGKNIPMFIKIMKDDEHDVKKDDNGNFFNVFIRKAEVEGKIGKIELEASENLPITWAQRKDVYEKLLAAGGNPEIQKILSAPENITVIHDALGLGELYLPGEEDTIKQYDEIKLLLNSAPIPTPDGQEMTSVEIDVDNDNHAIEYEVIRKWLTSESGRQAKIDNPDGYRNNLLHAKAHKIQLQPPPPQPVPPKINYTFKGEDLINPDIRQILDRAEQIQPAMQSQGASPNALPNQNQEAPIMGDQNVQVQQ